MSLRRAINEVLHPEKIEEGEDVYDKFGIQITKTRLKGGIGYQINYGERGRYIQVLKKDMNNLMKAMKTAVDAKQEIIMRDFFQLRKQMNEDQFGTFFIKFEGIKNPSKVDIAYERETQYTFGALMEDADIEMDGEPEFAGNVLKVYADKSEMKNINKFLNARNKLAKDTQAMMKKGAKVLSTKEIEKLYEKRADHFYVTAVLGKMANPNTTPKYSIQKFMKEN